MMAPSVGMERELPFQSIFPHLLRAILFALGDVLAMGARDASAADHARINRHFSWLCRDFKHGENRHFFDGSGRLEPLRTEGLRADSLRRAPHDVIALLEARQSLDLDEHQLFVQKGPTRISSLVLENYHQANERRPQREYESDRDAGSGIFLPSPLKIAIEFLTDPDLMESSEFAYYTARAFLFEVCRTCPVGFDAPKSYRKFSVADVKDEISRINTSLRPRHDSRGADPIKGAGQTRIGTVLRHLLAIDGSFHLLFESRGTALSYCRGIEDISDITPVRSAPFQFARSRRLKRLPSEGIITNRLFGIPVPLRGASTIFAGGLRLNSEHGLVVAVHGDAGAGKTSLALALATSLAPLGFQTLFMTAEETEADLDAKIQSLRPADIERITCVTDTGDNIKFINLSEPTSEEDEDTPIMDRVLSILNQNIFLSNEVVGDTGSVDEVLSPTKSIIILDGVHDILATDSESDSYDLLRVVVEACRKQRSLVILTTGTEWANNRGIDYLVDMSITVSNDPVSDFSPKPRREMTITKARHQLCSVGAHGFNIGGDRGFRFTPQTSYLLDALSIHEPHLPDQSLRKQLFAMQHTLLGRSLRGDNERLMQSDNEFGIFHRSNIFINGRGSAGKAALAMRAAMTPFVHDALGRRPTRIRCRVLIISFLYGSDYYQDIYERLKPLLVRENRRLPQGYHRAPDVLQLYPGHISSDELVFKVKSLIDAEILRGEPYTEIIFDGIHNVFLQFPELEDNVVFWPQMFSLLRQYDASMIITNTILVVDDQEAASGELNVDNRKSEPLRQALVYKTDFYLELNRLKAPASRRIDYDEFQVRVRSAIGQRVPTEAVTWNREMMVFVNADQGKLSV